MKPKNNEMPLVDKDAFAMARFYVATFPDS
jgi:hypothetical protein